jgi:hypothetical protein
MNIVWRAKNMLFSPLVEWRVIAGEQATVGDIFYGYILIIAAIPPVCGVIGFTLSGRANFGGALLGGMVQYIFALGAIFFAALIAQYLSSKYGGRDDLVQALKLVTYAHTPNWVGGLFFLVPSWSVFSLVLAIYGLYLLFAGATAVVAVPPERAAGYTLAVIIVLALIYAVISIIMGLVVGMGRMGIMM